jgi:ribose transport system substrate-binding protein
VKKMQQSDLGSADSPAGEPEAPFAVGLPRRELLRRAGAAGLGIAVFTAIPGCGSGGSAGAKKRIAFSHPDVGTGSDIVPPLLLGVREEAKKRGYDVVIGSGGDSVERQVAEVRTWIAQGFAAVTIGARDPRALAPVIKEAKEKGTVFVSYAATLPGAEGEVTFDNVQGGGLVGDDAARWVNEVKGGKAEVALLEQSTLQGAIDRTHTAAKHLLAAAPGAKIVARQDAVLAPDTLKATQSILQAHPNVSVVICLADDGALGARQALLSAGKDPDSVYVAGMDGGKRNLELILKGHDPIKASGALDIVAIGRASMDVPANIIEGHGPTRWSAQYTLASTQDKAETQRLLAQYEG